MGETAAGASEGAEAVFWNPAGLARFHRDSPWELCMGYNHLVSEARSGSLALSKPTRVGVFAGALTYFTQSPQTAYNALGDRVGSFSPTDVAISASYAIRIKIWHFGGTAKFIRSSLHDASGTAGAVDLGVQALHLTEAGEGAVDFGVVVSNLGTPIKVGGIASPLPLSIRSGILWHTAPYLNSGFDVVLPVDDDPYVSFGLEGKVGLTRQKAWKAFLRAGYNQRYTRGIDGLSGMTLGGGADLSRVRMDYAWVPFGDLGITHRVTMSVRF